MARLYVDQKSPKNKKIAYVWAKNVREAREVLIQNENNFNKTAIKISSIDINQDDPDFFDFLRWLHNTNRDDKYTLYHH